MHRYPARNIVAILLIFLFGASLTHGSEIFHWVDEEGVLTFSDWAPESGDIEVSKLVVRNSNPPDYDPDEDQNSVLEQAQRINTRWAELKEQREERRKRQLELDNRQRLPRYEEYGFPFYYRPGYYIRSVRPPGYVHRPPFKVQEGQLRALNQFGLLGSARPHSINSSAHLARINASKAVSGFSRPPQAGMPRHAMTRKDW